MRALILVAGAALALSACGDDGDDDRYNVDENHVVVVDEDADNGVGCDDPKTTDVIENCP